MNSQPSGLTFLFFVLDCAPEGPGIGPSGAFPGVIAAEGPSFGPSAAVTHSVFH